MIGTRALRAALEDPKVKKDHLVTMMHLFSQLGAYERAVQAGEAACRLDPTDAKLQAETRNLSAQATMTKGGYEKSGAAGGFRANVRDIEAQRKREEEERLVKSEDTLERVILNNKADYEARPNDPAAIQKFAKSLLERGTAEDEALAFKVLMKGFEATRTYRFKQLAGDIRLRVASRKIIELRDAAKETPEGSDQRKAYLSALRQFREAEIKEFEERVENYPTDLKLKYELGRRYYDIGNHEKAIEQFQVAQQAPGIANTVQNLLGQSFLSMGWLDEAEGTFRRALESHESANDDLGMSLRYNLMVTLAKRAADGRDLPAAEEAFKLASGIAIQQINFRDIRERREQLQALLKELRGARG
jgi:tetratricopeptide (TPR) repeat protein